MERKSSLSSFAEARGLSIRTGDESITKTPSKFAGLSSMLQRNGYDQQPSSIVAAARKRNAKVSLKCESLEVDTAHIRGLRSASNLVKTKSFTYGLTSGGSDSDMSQGSQSGIQVSFPAMNSMRATLNVPFVNSPFLGSIRDSFDSRGLMKTTSDIGNHQLSKLFKACTAQYLDSLHAFLHIEKREYTFNDTIDSSVDSGSRSSIQSGTRGLVLPSPSLSAAPSIVLSMEDDLLPVSTSLLTNEAMGRYIDVLISFSEVLQLEDRLPEATMLILAGMVNVNHAILPLQAKAALASREGSLSGTHQIMMNKNRPLPPTPFATGIATSAAHGMVFDEALLTEVDGLLNRLLSPVAESMLSSGSNSSRNSGQAVVNSGIEMLPGTDIPLFVSFADGRVVDKQCSLLAACYVYRDADSVENLHAITLLVKRFGVLLRAQGALAEAMVSLQAATHVFRVLSEACEEYLADLAGSYALLAATLAEIGIEEESTRMDSEARKMDMKALELASILATT